MGELLHLRSEKAGGEQGPSRAQILGFLGKLAEMPFDAGDSTAPRIRRFPSAKKKIKHMNLPIYKRVCSLFSSSILSWI